MYLKVRKSKSFRRVKRDCISTSVRSSERFSLISSPRRVVDNSLGNSLASKGRGYLLKSFQASAATLEASSSAEHISISNGPPMAMDFARLGNGCGVARRLRARGCARRSSGGKWSRSGRRQDDRTCSPPVSSKRMRGPRLPDASPQCRYSHGKLDSFVWYCETVAQSRKEV
jgi:hypothetical protein